MEIKKREIKFRGWMPREKRLIYEISVDREIPNMDDFFRKTAKDGFVWMQYTGLKDKNGKEIYEGDIIKFCYSDDCDKNPNSKWKTGEIYWNEEIINFGHNDMETGKSFFLYPISKHYEVIGNIYSNPDLIIYHEQNTNTNTGRV